MATLDAVRLDTIPGTENFATRLVAASPIAAGERLGRLTGTRSERPTWRTLQVGIHEHLDVDPPFAYLDHACDPTVEIDVIAREVRALRDVPAGEPLTFFYPATEWEMASPFVCRCGAVGCLGVVRGARHLPIQALLGHPLAPHIRYLLAVLP